MTSVCCVGYVRTSLVLIQTSKMLAPFPVYLKSAAASTSVSTTTTTTMKMNDSSDNLSDIIDLFPFSISSTYEPLPPRPPKNPERLKRDFVPVRSNLTDCNVL